MTETNKNPNRLVDRLPKVRGRYSEDVSLANITWFRVGGHAEVMYKPADIADLEGFLAKKPDDVPVTVLGVGSNVLVRDGGIPGVVVRLGRGFADMSAEGDQIHVGAGALDVNVALTCAEVGIGGLEFLCGVPGTIGGSIVMNAGSYGSEMKDIFVSATVLDGQGRRYRVTKEDVVFGYRKTLLPAGYIVVDGLLQGCKGDKAQITEKMVAIRKVREESQPIRTRTGGSTFANPEPSQTKDLAWQLIERAGCRGLRVGGAMVSEKHCNFLVNTGMATAADIECLGEKVRERVASATGVHLRWEIQCLGKAKVENSDRTKT